MAKSLNLKVSKAKLITQLEKALAERQKRFESNEKNQREYEKEMEKYSQAVLKLVKSGKATFGDVSKSSYYGRRRKQSDEFSVTVTIPKSLAPDEPKQPNHYQDWQWKSDRESITNALRMLEMSDDEYVTTSTLKSVSEYL
jgi:hypothetical protein